MNGDNFIDNFGENSEERFEDIFKPLSDEGILERAIELTVRNFNRIPSEDKVPNERMFQFEICHFFRQQDLIVQVEAPYQRLEKEEKPLELCDICLHSEKGVTWIDLKIVLHSFQSRSIIFGTNLERELSNFAKQLNCLNQQTEANHKKVGILIGFFDLADIEKQINTVNIKLNEGGQDAIISRIKHYDSVSLKGFEFKITSWIWSWEGYLNTSFSLINQ